MKISAFYVNQKQQTITEKEVKRFVKRLAKVGATITIIHCTTPLPIELINTPIIVNASSEVVNSGVDLIVQANPVGEAVDKIISVTDQLINGLQRVAEPVAYGFCIKGILEKMSGQQNVGDKHIKDSIKGYVMIQILPFVFDLIDVFR